MEGLEHEDTSIVQGILEKFLIGSESSYLDDINIILMLKALPGKIVEFNLAQFEMFNFNILQNSLIAF